MTNLFSSFDFFNQKFFFVIFILFYSLFLKVNFNNSNFYFLSFKMEKELLKYFNSLKINSIPKNYVKILHNLFLMVFFFNFLSLLPYQFNLTSQVSVLMMISIIHWLNLISYNLSANFNGLILHLIPEDSPVYMMLFLFVIEMVSNLIRPLTLMLRLMGNMVAGHIFLVLIFSLMIKVGLSVYAIFLLYYMVEMVVSFLQSYIFTTLMMMYFSEL